jgi:hypothetical protein
MTVNLDQELIQCFHASKVYMLSNKKFSSRLDKTALTFKLTHISFNYGAFQLSLGSWAIERQNNQIKHYVSSFSFDHYSGVL